MRFSSVNYHAYRPRKESLGKEIPCELCHLPFLKSAGKKEQKYCSRACSYTAKILTTPGKKGNTRVIRDLIRYIAGREKIWGELRKGISIHIIKLRTLKHIKGIRRTEVVQREKRFFKRINNALKRNETLFDNYYGGKRG